MKVVTKQEFALSPVKNFEFITYNLKLLLKLSSRQPAAEPQAIYKPLHYR